MRPVPRRVGLASNIQSPSRRLFLFAHDPRTDLYVGDEVPVQSGWHHESLSPLSTFLVVAGGRLFLYFPRPATRVERQTLVVGPAV